MTRRELSLALVTIAVIALGLAWFSQRILPGLSLGLRDLLLYFGAAFVAVAVIIAGLEPLARFVGKLLRRGSSEAEGARLTLSAPTWGEDNGVRRNTALRWVATWNGSGTRHGTSCLAGFSVKVSR